MRWFRIGQAGCRYGGGHDQLQSCMIFVGLPEVTKRDFIGGKFDGLITRHFGALAHPTHLV